MNRRAFARAIALSASMTVALAVAVAAPRRARAQGDPVAAEALFDEAKALIHQGNWAAACPKLAESQRLDPGVGTLLNLAECYDHIGRSARAWAMFREAEALALHAGQSDRSRYAAARAKQLEGKLVRLTIDVPDAARIAGLQVSRDHEAQAEAAWGLPIPIDPGDHVIEAQAPGYKPFSTRVTVAHDPVVVHIPPLEPEPAPPPVPPPPPPTPVVETPKTPPELPVPPPPLSVTVAEPTLGGGAAIGTRSAGAGGPMRATGFVLGATGLGGIGAGSLLGVLAIDRDNGARAAGCSPTTCPTQGGVDLTHQAVTFATAANVVFVVSAVLLGTGIVLVALAPHDSSTARVARTLLSPWSFE